MNISGYIGVLYDSLGFYRQFHRREGALDLRRNEMEKAAQEK